MKLIFVICLSRGLGDVYKRQVSDKAGAKPVDSRGLSIKFDSVRFSYPKAEEISLASLESVSYTHLTQPTKRIV